MEAHERWQYDDATQTQTLRRLVWGRGEAERHIADA